VSRRTPSPQVRLFILDVGHGSSAVLCDTNGVVVIDAGPGTALLEFLRDAGISRIDSLLISHADHDHISGVISLLESGKVPVGRVRLNSDALKGSTLWNDLVFLLDKMHKSRQVDFNVALTTGDTGKYDQGYVHIEILAPSLYLAGRSPGSTDRKGRRITTNSMSVVVRLSRDGAPLVLLPGDIDDAGFHNLLEDGTSPVSSVAVFPHHGGKPGSSDAAAFAKRFCNAVSPSVIIFSTGRSQHHTPRPDVVSATRKACPDTRIVCTQLSEHCASALPAEEPSHLTKSYSLGRSERKCCAGTITVLLRVPPSVLPAAKAHESFIRQSAPTALCLIRKGRER